MLRGVGNWTKILLTTAVEYLCVGKVKSSLLSFLKVFVFLSFFSYNLLKNLMLFSFTVFPLLFVGFFGCCCCLVGYLKMINDTTRINIIRHKKEKKSEAKKKYDWSFVKKKASGKAERKAIKYY